MPKKKKSASSATRPVAPTPAPATSQVPAKVGEKNWRVAIEKLKARRDKMSGDILRYRHDTGKLALELSAERSKEEGYRTYGSHTVHDICVELAESDSTVYACMKFTSQNSPEQLQHLIDQKWAWRAVAALVTVEDPKQRKKLQNTYEKGKFENSDALKEAVAEHNTAAKLDGSKTEKRGGGAGTTAQKLKGVKTVVGTFIARTVPEFVAGLESFVHDAADMSPRTSEIASEHIQAAKESIPEMHAQLDRVAAAIKKAGL